MDIHTVLVPTDFSEHAEHAFIWAVSLAEQWHARIVLVHAVPLLHHVSVPERLLIDIPHLDSDRVMEAEKHLQDFLTEKRKPASVTVETRIVRGDPFWAICQAAEQTGTRRPHRDGFARPHWICACPAWQRGRACDPARALSRAHHPAFARAVIDTKPPEDRGDHLWRTRTTQ